MTIDIDVDAIAEAVAKRLGGATTSTPIWNCPNAIVSTRQIAEYTGMSDRQVRNFLRQYGAPKPVRLPLANKDGGTSYTDMRFFVKEIVQYFEKNRRHVDP